MGLILTLPQREGVVYLHGDGKVRRDQQLWQEIVRQQRWHKTLLYNQTNDL